MGNLVDAVEKLKRSDIRGIVDNRMAEFAAKGRGPSDEIFSELCFCLMTANFNAQRSIGIQRSVGAGFCTLPEKQLHARLKEGGHRFPEARARYMAEAQKQRKEIEDAIERLQDDEPGLRKWLAENVRGLGCKEASHFMRNIGFTDIAIIDFHIIDLLVRYGIVARPKTLTPKKYLEIEAALRGIARKAGLNLAELDLYLWYMETGKILK
jgi:N-glycosylase/DNA lyase